MPSKAIYPTRVCYAYSACESIVAGILNRIYLGLPCWSNSPAYSFTSSVLNSKIILQVNGIMFLMVQYLLSVTNHISELLIFFLFREAGFPLCTPCKIRIMDIEKYQSAHHNTFVKVLPFTHCTVEKASKFSNVYHNTSIGLCCSVIHQPVQEVNEEWKRRYTITFASVCNIRQIKKVRSVGWIIYCCQIGVGIWYTYFWKENTVASDIMGTSLQEGRWLCGSF